MTMPAKKSLPKKNSSKRKRLTVTLVVTAAAFLILVFTMLLVGAAAYAAIRAGILHIAPSGHAGLFFVLAFFAVASILVGTIVSFLVGRFSISALDKLIQAMNRLAAGDYKARLTLGDGRLGQEISKSFNTMARELDSTEMLRSDFVNNFSHEFKTPIVSIYGFARLLRRGGLSEEQSREYLSIIEQESGRLSAMATNVLNLTKIENQSILSGVSTYNLSEQLRRAILLLEKKWTAKNLALSCAFREHSITASEDLLGQIWLNLLDNAVKFTPQDGEITVSIFEEDEDITVSVKNTGSEIPPQDLDRVFAKFYQCDTSHSSEGTGTGLAIVKKIADLHHGQVWAESGSRETAFFVRLPKTPPQ